MTKEPHGAEPTLNGQTSGQPGRWANAAVRGLIIIAAAALAQALLGAWADRLPYDRPRVDLIGSSSARHRVVYLHGMDTYGPAWIEIRNRETLRALARDLGLFVALPRAPERMWPYETAGEYERSLSLVRSAARASFPEGSRFGVVGFSQGGYFAGRLFQSRRDDDIAWIIAVGSTGDVLSGGSLVGHGPFRIVIGNAEADSQSAHAFARLLARRKADVRVFEFEGVHGLPLRGTRDALLSVLGAGERLE